MSMEVTKALVQQYTAGLTMKLQQMDGSRLWAFTNHDPDQIIGKFVYFDLIGPVEMQAYTGRHADTVLSNTPHERRRGTQQGWVFADMIDTPDKLKMLEDPTSKYTMNAVAAAGRKLDDVIIAAMTGDAYTVDEEEVATAVPLPDAQKVAVASAGLTITKLRSAVEKLDLAEVPEEGRCIAYGAQQKNNLLATTEVTSSDFNTVKALVRGEIDTFLGLKFIPTQRLPKAAGVRYLPVWHKDWVGAWYGENLMVDVGVRRDKNVNTQVYVREHVGATRRAETGVVEIACLEA